MFRVLSRYPCRIGGELQPQHRPMAWLSVPQRLPPLFVPTSYACLGHLGTPVGRLVLEALAWPGVANIPKHRLPRIAGRLLSLGCRDAYMCCMFASQLFLCRWLSGLLGTGRRAKRMQHEMLATITLPSEMRGRRLASGLLWTFAVAPTRTCDRLPLCVVIRDRSWSPNAVVSSGESRIGRRGGRPSVGTPPPLTQALMGERTCMQGCIGEWPCGRLQMERGCRRMRHVRRSFVCPWGSLGPFGRLAIILPRSKVLC